ncbi:hypothetical protein [Amycolatopsis anabasis]|uniref:hypothetical protein n=1 Tax=Amycolatopsis anabasis TaxID=1840409 RepID=UPI0031B61232
MSEEQKSTSEEKKEEKSGGIKPSQVVAAALAAVTAAFLGSTLGVAGTVVGAGIASVVTTVGGELYLRSLRKTREAAQRTKEAARALADPRARQQTRVVQQPRQVPGQHATGYRPQRTQAFQAARGSGETTSRLPVAGDGRSGNGERTVFIPRPNLQQPPAEGPETGEEQPRRRFRLRWPLIIGTSVVAFVVAILAITGFEGITGSAISGGQGSTIGHLWSGGGSGKSDEKRQDQPPSTGDDKNVQPSQSRTPPTGTPRNGSGGDEQPPTSGSKPSTPSSSAPKSSDKPTPTPSAPPSNGNNAPGGSDQGSDGQRSGNQGS